MFRHKQTYLGLHYILVNEPTDLHFYILLHVKSIMNLHMKMLAFRKLFLFTYCDMFG